MAGHDSTGEIARKSAPDELRASAGQYVVVARRYRPQDFGQLIGQGQVAQALANAITTNRVGHAYLFTGARGVGKTSTARIFAKALNCVNGPTTTPCGQCDMCQGIASGGDVDCLEIDGASNRGIDEIRQLRSNVNVRPSRARFKIYIIDEVHMLTTPAFNALLKTLEEPPEHVKFIFCTTEADKIPITVLSRCQRFDFAPIELKQIIERLKQICTSEGVEADAEALQIIARRAAGSMRDSQSLLEQLLSFGGQRITVADVHSLLGTADASRLTEIVGCILQRDAAAALQQVEKAATEGVDLGALTEQLLGYLRDCLAALVGCSPELLLNAAESEYEQVAAVGQQLGLETLLAMAQILDQTLSRLRQSTHVRTLVEMALVRLCKLENLDALPALVAELRGGGVASAASGQGPGARGQERHGGGVGSPASGSPASGSLRPPAASTTLRPEPVSRAAAPPEPPSAQKKTAELVSTAAPSAPSTASEGPPLDSVAAAALWKQTLEQIGDMTAISAGRAERVAISGPNKLVVSFRKAYNQAMQYCERADQRQKLEQALSRTAGRGLRLEFALLADEASPAAVVERAANRPVNRRQRQQEVLRHPLIRRAAELFDTELIDLLDPPPSEETSDQAT
jgi:DNA polymerase-3 subunit gamma/tau